VACNDEPTSLLGCGINYGCKKFYSSGHKAAKNSFESWILVSNCDPGIVFITSLNGNLGSY